MTWHVYTCEAGGLEGRSSALRSEWIALAFAADLSQHGVKVLRIEGPGVEIPAEEIEERRAVLREERDRSRYGLP